MRKRDSVSRNMSNKHMLINISINEKNQIDKGARKRAKGINEINVC